MHGAEQPGKKRGARERRSLEGSSSRSKQKVKNKQKRLLHAKFFIEFLRSLKAIRFLPAWLPPQITQLLSQHLLREM